MKRIAIVLLILTATTGTAPSEQLFNVTGVDRSDVLNVRADIDRVDSLGDATIVGVIPHDGEGVEATGVSVMFNGSRWREVRLAGRTGWVNDRFLAAAGMVRPGDRLMCAGTEPFWSLGINGRRADLSRPDAAPLSLRVTAKRSGINRTDIWSYRFEGAGGRQLTGLVVFTDACSDGMSDRISTFDIYVLGLNPERGPAHGCCSFAR